ILFILKKKQVFIYIGCKLRRAFINFLDIITNRYSVRKYLSTQVQEEKLNKILEAARLAPTAVNRQAFRLIIIKTSGREQELKPIYHREWFTQAPLIICVCAIPGENWVRKGDNKNYCDVDIAIIADHIILAATGEGLGTCWIAAFDPVAARKILRIPDRAEPVIFITIGYADDRPKEKTRKSLNELVSYNRWMD
ncbi:MAG: nitroreductase family protein, partial [bacterium]